MQPAHSDCFCGQSPGPNSPRKGIFRWQGRGWGLCVEVPPFTPRRPRQPARLPAEPQGPLSHVPDHFLTSIRGNRPQQGQQWDQLALEAGKEGRTGQQQGKQKQENQTKPLGPLFTDVMPQRSEPVSVIHTPPWKMKQDEIGDGDKP